MIMMMMFLADHSVTEIVATCSPMIGQFCYATTVVSTDKERL